MTKVQLAAEIGLSVRRMKALETEGETPSHETVAKLANALDFPEDYFIRPDPPEVAVDATSFRSFSRLPANRRDAALAAAAHALEIADWVFDEFHVPSPDLPDLRRSAPEVAASAVRSHWGLGDQPAPNLIHLLESKGVFVFSLPDDSTALDALSFWHGARPVVFLTQHKSAERSRWDAAHELGHLLLHVGTTPQGKTHEDEADRFASCFLLPQAGVMASAPAMPSLPDIVDHKIYWQVSAMAYVRRLHDLGLVTDWQYRTLVIECSQAGYRRREDDIQRERTQLWDNVLDLLAQDGERLPQMAARFDLNADELGSLIFRLTSFDGDNKVAGRSTAPLRLVPDLDK